MTVQVINLHRCKFISKQSSSNFSDQKLLKLTKKNKLIKPIEINSLDEFRRICFVMI